MLSIPSLSPVVALQPMDAAIDMAQGLYNELVVCSSGNDGQTSVGYPSSHPKVFEVGATPPSDERATFSNHGPDFEIPAPGAGIFTTTTGNAYSSTRAARSPRPSSPGSSR